MFVGGLFFVLAANLAVAAPVDLLAERLVVHLNTRLNPVATQIISAGAMIRASQFDGNKPTKVLIHGFLDRFYMPWWMNMVKELLANGDFNVVRLDWSAGNLPPYSQAVSNSRAVGNFVGKLLLQLRDQLGANITHFHLIGHSLGAHAAGYAGAMLHENGALLGRITGLDPAGPYFTNMPASVRLDPSDARLVDTIVTDGKELFNTGLVPAYGSLQPMGHLNFYPNGGKDQPGCSKVTPPIPMFNLAALNNLIGETAVLVADSLACSHMRAVTLFSESINNRLCTMQAYQCDSFEQFAQGACLNCAGGRCTTFGYQVDPSLAESGQTKRFFAMTTSRSPFCRNPIL